MISSYICRPLLSYRSSVGTDLVKGSEVDSGAILSQEVSKELDRDLSGKSGSISSSVDKL